MERPFEIFKVGDVVIIPGIPGPVFIVNENSYDSENELHQTHPPKVECVSFDNNNSPIVAHYSPQILELASRPGKKEKTEEPIQLPGFGGNTRSRRKKYDW